MKKRNKLSYLATAALVILSAALLLTGCSSAGNTDILDDEHVQAVKNAIPDSYPNTTYGEAFNSFFGSPTWRYFVGTQNGPDENEDGKPDYTRDNVDVVEFKGKCSFAGVDNVTACVQFELDMEAGTFEPVYLSMNDIPQNNLMLTGLMEKVFSEAPGTSGTQEEPKEQEEQSSPQTQSSDKPSSANITSAEIVGMYTDYADGYMYKLNVYGNFSTWTASITYTAGGENSSLTYTSGEVSSNPYFTAGSSITGITATITPYDENGKAGQAYTTVWDVNRVEKLEGEPNNTDSEYMYGEISTMGGNIVGYSTSYVCNNGAPETVRTNLGDGWHVMSCNSHNSYGITWYELYDSDDGDYYGWVDGNYIIWY